MGCYVVVVITVITLSAEEWFLLFFFLCYVVLWSSSGFWNVSYQFMFNHWTSEKLCASSLFSMFCWTQIEVFRASSTPRRLLGCIWRSSHPPMRLPLPKRGCRTCSRDLWAKNSRCISLPFCLGWSCQYGGRMRLFSIWPSARFCSLHSEMKNFKAVSTSASNVSLPSSIKSESCNFNASGRTSHTFWAESTIPLLSSKGRLLTRWATYWISVLVMVTSAFEALIGYCVCFYIDGSSEILMVYWLRFATSFLSF